MSAERQIKSLNFSAELSKSTCDVSEMVHLTNVLIIQFSVVDKTVAFLSLGCRLSSFKISEKTAKASHESPYSEMAQNTPRQAGVSIKSLRSATASFKNDICQECDN